MEIKSESKYGDSDVSILSAEVPSKDAVTEEAPFVERIERDNSSPVPDPIEKQLKFNVEEKMDEDKPDKKRLNRTMSLNRAPNPLGASDSISNLLENLKMIDHIIPGEITTRAKGQLVQGRLYIPVATKPSLPENTNIKLQGVPLMTRLKDSENHNRAKTVDNADLNRPPTKDQDSKSDVDLSV
jgi:hypothetical protein